MIDGKPAFNYIVDGKVSVECSRDGVNWKKVTEDIFLTLGACSFYGDLGLKFRIDTDYLFNGDVSAPKPKFDFKKGDTCWVVDGDNIAGVRKITVVHPECLSPLGGFDTKEGAIKFVDFMRSTIHA